jgi:integrase
MGKHWRKYERGIYRLGQLHGEAVVTWRDATGPHRYRLGASEEIAARSALDAFVRKRELLTAKSSRTVADLYAAYQADREKDGKVIANFKESWKALKSRFGHLSVEDINADLCRRYAEERLANGKSVGTVWTELTRLRSAMNWAAKRDVIVKAPYVWVPTKPAPKSRVLSPDELRALLDGCEMPHVRLFVILAIATGGRSGALLDLTWAQVNFEAGTINLNTKPEINPLTKAVRKSRAIVPMNNLARAALLEAQEGAITDWVIEWNGDRIQCIRNGFSSAVRRAGLGRDVTPHVLRHTAASWMLNAKIPMIEISRYLGHRDERTTELIYAKHDPLLLQAASQIVDLPTSKRAGKSR